MSTEKSDLLLCKKKKYLAIIQHNKNKKKAHTNQYTIIIISRDIKSSKRRPADKEQVKF